MYLKGGEGGNESDAQYIPLIERERKWWTETRRACTGDGEETYKQECYIFC